MKTHWPAPWKEKRSGTLSNVYDANDELIAMDVPYENASLIAAAPELLSALKYLADKCNDPALVAIADEAITKATK